MRTSSNHSQRGSVIFVFLLALVFIGTVAVALNLVGEDAFQAGLLLKAREKGAQEVAVVVLAEEEAIGRLRTAGELGADGVSAVQRGQVLRDLVTWGIPGVEGVRAEFEAPVWPSGLPFSRDNVLATGLDVSGVHPLGSMAACVATAATTVHYEDPYLGPRTQAVRWAIREIPTSEVGYVACLPVVPADSTVSVQVAGHALLAGGLEDGGGPVRVTATCLLAPFGVPAGGVVGTRTFIDPLFRPTWGIAPGAMAANRPGLSEVGIRQSYFSRAQCIVTFANGKMSNAPAGVTLAKVVDGTNRITIDLAALAEPSIYINCVRDDDIDGGVVVLGSGSPGPARIVSTNGRLWLSGDNVHPVLTATSAGHITLTDGGGTLGLNWTGYILSPEQTEWHTPQAGLEHRLNVHGTVVAGGANTGNLRVLAIQQVSGSALNAVADRFQVLFPPNP